MVCWIEFPIPYFASCRFLVIAFLLFLIVFPLYFMATTAFKQEAEIYSQLTWFPQSPTIGNFADVISVVPHSHLPAQHADRGDVGHRHRDRRVSTLAAYALTRLRFPAARSWPAACSSSI